MTLREFIKANREGIDAQILAARYRYDGNGGRGTIPDPPPRFNDAERREWILKYEPLYRWARSEGVAI